MRALVVLVALTGVAYAQAPELPPIQIHGFIGEGAFVSTDNDYIGESSRGTLELFEAGLNVSTEVADRLRAGIQLYARDVGDFNDMTPRIDWAFLDYHWKPWLGLRVGVTKMPYGLYNEYADIDSARTAILMPQGVYPLRNRSVLLSQTGFAIYGNYKLGAGGSLDYQALLGTLQVPETALDLNGAELDSTDTKYVTGGQVFWSPPIEGLRIGATYLRASIDFNVTLDKRNIDLLIMAGLEPADFDGKVVISQRPDTIVIGSIEYVHDDWLFAAEYARWFTHQVSTLPEVVFPTLDDDNERFYVMANRRWSRCFETGLYYSLIHVDPDDRFGNDEMKFPEKAAAFQRDLALSARFDINDHWLWKAEAHYIDGTADLLGETEKPERFWGLFLIKTTVTF
jgi:hypothetical protein